MLGIIEIAIFLLISTLLIVNAEQNTLNVFVPGEDGVQPAFQGMIFCLLAFIGFEAVAPLGEEDGGAAPHDSARADLVGGPRRPVLRLQHVRRDGVLRPREDG